MKKKKRIELNANHYQIIDFVLDFVEKNGKKPFMYQICYGLNKTARAISKALTNAIPDYPPELMVSPVQYERSHHFEKGMTLIEFATACGCSKENVYAKKEEYEFLGIKFRSERKPYNLDNPHNLNRSYAPGKRSSEKEVFIKVLHGRFKGCGGYINEFTDVANVILWVDGQQVPARLETCEYREVRKAI